MKILRVTKKPTENKEKKFWEDYGVMLHQVSPTLLSAVTALSIAKAVDKNDIDIIEVYRMEDATAALSAKTISKNKNLKVVFSVTPNFKRPRNIHSDIIKKTDGWVFASDRLNESFKEVLKDRTVIQQTSIERIDIEMPNIGSRPVTIAWIGEIKDHCRLKEAMDKIIEIKSDVIFRICGAGKARDVMPAVKYSRALPNKERILWVGEEYDTIEEITRCQAAIKTDNDLTITETQILQSGRKVLEPKEISDFVESPTKAEETEQYSAERYANALRNYYVAILRK